MQRIRIALAIAVTASLFPALAAAQPAPADSSTPNVAVPNVVQSCRDARSSAEIVVCAERGRSPYRLPEQREGFDINGPVDSVSRERHRLYEQGASGIGSCSAVGPGGWTGCQFIEWKGKHEQKAGQGRVGVTVGPRRAPAGN